jgi:hypothetical protein
MDDRRACADPIDSIGAPAKRIDAANLKSVTLTVKRRRRYPRMNYRPINNDDIGAPASLRPR